MREEKDSQQQLVVAPSLEIGKAFLVVLSLIIACFAFIYFLTPELYSQASISHIIWAYLSTFAIIGAFSLRWKNNTSVIQKDISIKELVNMEFMSTFAKFLSPFQLNIPFRSFFLKSRGVPVSDSISLSLFELFVEFLVASIGVVVLGLSLGYNYAWLLLVPLILIASFPLLKKPTTTLLLHMQKKIRHPWVNKVLDILIDLPHAVEKYSTRFNRVLSLFFLTVIIYLLKSFRMWLVIRAFGLSVPLGVIAFLICVVSILSTVSRIPMGIGLQEISGVLLFTPFMEANYAFSVLLITRIIGTSVILFFGGGLFFFKYMKSIKKAISKKRG